MAQGGGPCFNLPDEILSVIPTDPYDQLDLARKLTSMAVASRVTNLETEASRLRQKLGDKDRRVQELEDKVFELETACKEAESRLRIAHEDNMKIAKERDSLALTAKRLSRDLSKLETFKKQLMQSLNDENTQTETVDIVTYDQSIPQKHSKNDKESNDCRERHSYIGPIDNGNINDNVTKQAGQKYSMTQYINPRFTPSGTPKTITSLSPRGYSAAGSPQRTPGNASPTTLYDGRGSLSSWFPSSQQSSAANSPPRGRPLQARNPRKMDGKEFFRQARSRLSLEQFSAFLANIKDLNAQKQSREETLRKAEEIFGTDNKDLYISFQGLLNRNMH